MRKVIVIMCLLLGTSMLASALPIYNFSYTGLTGGFTDALFTFPETSYLTAGTYTISATLTQGGNSWTFTQLFIGANGANGFCFNLGTAGVTNPTCAGFTFPGGGSNTSQGDIIDTYFNPGGIPTGSAVFSHPGDPFNGFTAANSFASTTGTATLNIIPEPASLILVGVALLVCSLALRRRSAPGIPGRRNL